MTEDGPAFLTFSLQSSAYLSKQVIFFLTIKSHGLIIVNTMNNKTNAHGQKLAAFQAGRLKELIEEIIHCCQERMFFQSQKFDLTPSELRCILLFNNEKYLTVKGMAQKLEVAKSRVTKIMEGLLKKRLVQCIDDPGDARVKLFSPTPAGQKKYEKLNNFIKEIHQHLLISLKPEERKAVLFSLELLRSSMEVIKEKLF
jgi:DNA-binding MarR family transcriptional regulator